LNYSENQIAEIVRKVINDFRVSQSINYNNSLTNNFGLFSEVNDAVEAAKSSKNMG